MTRNDVRIIGGKWKGRKLAFPDRPHLRPTLGRVRETLFNWLRADVVGSRCLDLFAGSGALGLEAASRGAAAVTLVDGDRRVVRSLRDNVARLGADNVTVICNRADRMLRRQAGPWDLVFVDPPFAANLAAATLDMLAEIGALAPEGLIYVEVSRREPLPTGPWRAVREAEAGETRFGLLATP